MIIEYKHPDLNEEVGARAGYYCPLEERLLSCRGRDVLYVLGHACLDNPCCGKGGEWTYIQVPGFLVRTHAQTADRVPRVSDVEIIEDRESRQEITDWLAKKHRGAQIEIWGIEYRPSAHFPLGAEGAPACGLDTGQP